MLKVNEELAVSIKVCPDDGVPIKLVDENSVDTPDGESLMRAVGDRLCLAEVEILALAHMLEVVDAEAVAETLRLSVAGVAVSIATLWVPPLYNAGDGVFSPDVLGVNDGKVGFESTDDVVSLG